MKSLLKISTLSLVLIFSSCASLLDIDPQQSIASDKALTTPEAIRANLADIYANFKNVVLYGRDFLPTAEILADNCDIVDRAGGRYVQQAANAPTAHFNNWAVAYATINEINLLLEALPKVVATETFVNETEGQVRALRALLYFDLIRTYAYEPNMAPTGLDRGGVPLALTGILTPGQIELLSRASVAEVYAQIYADLTVAIAKAPLQPAGATSAKYYVSRTFANGLFAKVALYNQDYAKAEQLATDAIALGSLVPTAAASIVANWRLNNHPESLFEIGFTTPGETIGVNESIASAYASRSSLTATGAATGNAAVVPSAAFLALHAATDVRRALYQNGLRTPIRMECTKFLHKTGTTYMDNIPVLRTSEVFLIRAEARARKTTPDEAGAREDLNLIAARVPVVYDATTTGTALIDAILAQRRLELAFEGDRWFDLKRRGTDLMKPSGNLLFDDYRRLASLPVREILINSNLVQNSGY